MTLLTQSGIIPFDLGREVPLKRLVDSKVVPRGFRPFRKYSNTLLGLHWIHCENDQGVHIFLHRSGFGCLSACLAAYTTLSVRSISLALKERRRLHQSIIHGEHALCVIVSELRNICQVLASGGSKLKRRDFWGACPYVFSVFSVQLPDLDDENRGDHCRLLAALLEPSAAEIEDSTCLQRNDSVEAIEQRIRNLSIETARAMLVDHDISSATSVFISWASVLITGCSEADITRTLREVLLHEVRLQTAWTMVFFVNKWSGLALLQRCREREWEGIKWNLARMTYFADNLVDASLGTRHKKLYEQLTHTSGIEEERSKAERGLALASEYEAVLRRKSDRAYRVIVEASLFFFGLCQAIPLFVDTPLVRLPTFAIGTIILLSLALIARRHWTIHHH